MGLRKILVSLCIGVGAVGLGAAASAAVDGIGDEPTTTTSTIVAGGETTTTTVAPVTEPPTTEAPTTVPPVTEPPATEAPTTVPPVTEPPVAQVDQPANLYGQCTAFAGRAQPGNSRAWERLDELAGGDIDGLCAEVLGAPRPDDGDETPEGTEPSDDADDEAGHPSAGSQRSGHAGANRPGGNGRGGPGRR